MCKGTRRIDCMGSLPGPLDSDLECMSRIGAPSSAQEAYEAITYAKPTGPRPLALGRVLPRQFGRHLSRLMVQGHHCQARTPR